MDLEKDFMVGVTKDYEMFEFLDSNRQPNKNIVTKLKASIQENGVQIPIIVNQKKQIVDGQHRFWALRELGYNVPFIISKTWKEDKHTIEINNTGSRWNALDYANYAAVNGNLDVDEALKISRQWEKETAKKTQANYNIRDINGGKNSFWIKDKTKK